jgi:DNA-binding MarR family transcriptional regulator
MTLWHTGQAVKINEELHGHGARLPTLMRQGYLGVIDYVHRRLGEEGFDDVRPAHMTIFQHIDPEGSRVGELAERTQLTNQSVGYLVDYLEEHDYVERAADPTNRRATLVKLTDRGWLEMAACARILDEIEAGLGATFGREKLEQLDELLTAFTRAVERLE